MLDLTDPQSQECVVLVPKLTRTPNKLDYSNTKEARNFFQLGPKDPTYRRFPSHLAPLLSERKLLKWGNKWFRNSFAHIQPEIATSNTFQTFFLPLSFSSKLSKWFTSYLVPEAFSSAVNEPLKKVWQTVSPGLEPHFFLQGSHGAKLVFFCSLSLSLPPFAFYVFIYILTYLLQTCCRIKLLQLPLPPVYLVNQAGN